MNIEHWLGQANALYEQALLNEEAQAFGGYLIAAIASGTLGEESAAQRLAAAVADGIPAERITRGFWSAYLERMLQDHQIRRSPK